MSNEKWCHPRGKWQVEVGRVNNFYELLILPIYFITSF